VIAGTAMAGGHGERTATAHMAMYCNLIEPLLRFAARDADRFSDLTCGSGQPQVTHGSALPSRREPECIRSV